MVGRGYEQFGQMALESVRYRYQTLELADTRHGVSHSVSSDHHDDSHYTGGHEIKLRRVRWVRSWILFRLAIIAQGISARAALGQASSADAVADNRIFNFFGRMAWEAKQDADKEQGAKL